MSGVRIDYGGVAVGAKEDFVPSVIDKTYFSDLTQLNKEGLTFPNYGNPCELYTVLLDGNTKPIPTETDGVNLGWWSEQISTETGEFVSPVVITLTADDVYSSSGITFTFDTENNIYSNYLYIKWYRDDVLLDEMDFFPDSPFYFCENKVEFYNKIEVTFYSINTSHNRLRLHSIDYGMKISFFGEELRNARVAQEIDALSTSIPISTSNFTIDSKKNIEFAFEEKQPVSIYFDDELRATSFIKTAKRKGKNLWDIQAEDYIGILDKIDFAGGIYENKLLTELVAEISAISKVPISVDESLSAERVWGYIPYTTCRNALMLITFSVCAVADTSNTDSVRIHTLNDDIAQTVPLERIRQGQSFDNQSRITSVVVPWHRYRVSNERVEIYTASDEDIGNEIFVKFSEPFSSLYITNGSIIEQHTNFAKILVQSGCVLTGLKYKHSVINKSIAVNDFGNSYENTINIPNATLVSSRNIDKVLNNCYNYYKNMSFVNLKIIEGKKEVETGYAKYGEAKYGEALYGVESESRAVVSDPTTKVGDVVVSQTEYLGDVEGRILKQTYTLNGNILVKDSKLKRS